MSVNKDKPHVMVLSEDDANRQMAVGFLREIGQIRQMQILHVAGGWRKVLDRFQSEHVRAMNRHRTRFMVLLIDFDGREDRPEDVKAAVPDHLTGRVFVLSTWTKPEELKKSLGAFETIGAAMATDCREGTAATWGHELLQHNAPELERLRERVRPILF